MYLPSKVLWCFVLLFVALSSEFQENSTNGDKQSDSSTVRYDLFISSMKYRDNEIKSTRCVSPENFIKNDDEMEYEFYINSTKNERKENISKQYESRKYIIKNCEESNQISMKSAANSTDINDSIKEIENSSSIERKSNFESNEYESDEDELDEDKSDEDESDEDESDEDESDEDESDEDKPDEYKSDEYESDEYESDEDESDEDESDEYESDEYELDENDYNDTELPYPIIISSFEECLDGTCVQLCCPLYNFMTDTGKCVANENGTYFLPKMYIYKDGPDHPAFFVTVHDPCLSQDLGKSLLSYNEYYFLTNGSLYQGPGKFILQRSYCLASFNLEIYEVMVCNNQKMYPIYVFACLLISLPFLLVTFVVYSILPELQNMHGYTLRAHIASLFIAYVIMYYDQQDSELQRVDDKICCIALAYILNFFLLSTFFWLNVICFDIWWKFRYNACGRTLLL
ncbi:uncharacterized protein LOC113005085 [Solenopsis invicta]|uniref:uncharacterized protein LOC113005085 n=1 Tax=Solenopsis invicta TaxID=13686 RepID=UPI00193D5F6A|nr:uncharacterized protein LOC113005085 [Solenopsis invicta]